jgi:hypothetical protein
MEKRETHLPWRSATGRMHLEAGEAIDDAFSDNAVAGKKVSVIQGWPKVWLMDRDGGFGRLDGFYCPRSGQPVPPDHVWCTPCLAYNVAPSFHGGRLRGIAACRRLVEPQKSETQG